MSENGYSSPYYAWERLDDLNSASSKFDGGLNLQMDREDIKGLNLPQMSLNLSNIDMGSSESPPTITYNPTVRLRDLDFTKEGDGFHEIKPDQEQPGQDQAAQEQSAQEQSAQEQSAQEQSAQENTIQNRTHMETSDQMESEFSDSDDAESDDSGLDDGYDHRNGLNAGLKEKPLSKDSHQDPQVPENKDASSSVWRYDGSKPAGFENNVGLFISPFSGDVPHQSSTGV
ncbi:hypothetical protein COL26b_011647 [Colletotrichum chrysophilum]|uniref:uncharacterized protein n=1 Tax=Colletotrichum chrysophilum TaxID=1836956 RepID=UPI002300C5F0|nr:uncharacterized protein COL26b_011647 [Colletotrichum chrysophilum]KAJ0366425.1 hypothetical protein COL26b_011647 [Colletotrichum chrysophilum]